MIRHFTDLEAWKMAHRLAIWVYAVTRNFPKEELFGLTSQLRRAAVSVVSNIAEGFSRTSAKEKAQFYSMALGSLTELHAQLLISRDIGLLSKEKCREGVDLVEQVGRLLTGLTKSVRDRP